MKKKIKALGLIAPLSLWEIDSATLAMMIGGCGPGKGGDCLVPDTLYGLNITPACAIHDYMYAIGKTEKDREEADNIFLDNMLIIINQRSANSFMRWIRRYLAMSYYSAVRDFGGDSFKQATII